MYLSFADCAKDPLHGGISDKELWKLAKQMGIDHKLSRIEICDEIANILGKKTYKPIFPNKLWMEMSGGTNQTPINFGLHVYNADNANEGVRLEDENENENEEWDEQEADGNIILSEWLLDYVPILRTLYTDAFENIFNEVKAYLLRNFDLDLERDDIVHIVQFLDGHAMAIENFIYRNFDLLMED